MLAITSGMASQIIEKTNQSVSRLMKASIIATSLPNVDGDQSRALREPCRQARRLRLEL